jgi:hypothetical protein
MSEPRHAPGELPPEALAALARGSKIEAIKIVRETQGLGLKEAKELVDAWQDAHPAPRTAGPRTDSGLRRVVMIALLIAAAYAIYSWFAGGAAR